MKVKALTAALAMLQFWSLASVPAATEAKSIARVSRLAKRLPYSVGSRWCYRNYEVSTGETNRTRIEIVTNVNENAVQVQSVDRVSGNDEAPTIETWNTLTGMRNPNMKVGDAWKEPAFDGKVMVGESDSVVVGKELLSTLIGPVETYRIDTHFTYRSNKYHQMIWYSKDIGNFVKLFYLDEHDQPTQGSEITCFSRSKL